MAGGSCYRFGIAVTFYLLAFHTRAALYNATGSVILSAYAPRRVAAAVGVSCYAAQLRDQPTTDVRDCDGSRAVLSLCLCVRMPIASPARIHAREWLLPFTTFCRRVLPFSAHHCGHLPIASTRLRPH